MLGSEANTPQIMVVYYTGKKIIKFDESIRKLSDSVMVPRTVMHFKHINISNYRLLKNTHFAYLHYKRCAWLHSIIHKERTKAHFLNSVNEFFNCRGKGYDTPLPKLHNEAVVKS